MKNIKMFGMAMFAVLFCVGFSACSKDEPQTNPGNEKKLNSIMAYGETGNFTYDSKNQLIATKFGSSVYYCSWGKDNFTAAGNYRYYNFTISGGLFMKAIEDDGSVAHTFFYNADNKLISLDKNSLTWDGNTLLNVFDNERIRAEFTYGNTTCKGYFPIAILIPDELGMDTQDFFYALPEYWGMETNKLPIKVSALHQSGDISYTFTEDGYVESCTLLDSYGRAKTFRFTWK